MQQQNASFRVLATMFVALLFAPQSWRAQDQQFTQFNAAPTSFNPAYAGVSGQARLATLYRAQWTSLP
jgi:hypothetical protein